MIRLNYIITLFFICVFSLFVNAQRFGGGLTLSGTFSQIDGDKVYGFHKAGYEFGIYGKAQLSSIADLEIHFSYNKRGSQSTADENNDVKINLNYLDVPILFIIKDWPETEGYKTYYHMSFFGGFSIGKLISSSSLNGIDKDFKKDDLSWILGATYFYAPNWGVSAKYTRSLSPIYKYYDNNAEVEMISYFISLGLNYKFK